MPVKTDTLSINDILETFARTGQDYFSLADFKTKLQSGKQLRIKYGVDVTAAFLHLGHAVNLWMMRKLQDYGHKVVFLIGDFTTRIGDPTGKSDTRPIIPQEQIEKNANEFIKQVSLVLKTDDPELFEIRRNSEWFDTMQLSDFLGLLSLVTHTRLISRDMFQRRIEEQKDIYMHELLYPILQGYDSEKLFSDLTIVGSDQLFNEMMGKFYQEKFGQNPQIIITTKITPGLDGKNKQSKSLNNYIALTDSPRDKFGKAMSMPDAQVVEWMEVYTDIPIATIQEHRKQLANGINPRNSKVELAYSLVEKYHNKLIAEEELKWFNNTFSKKDFPDDAPVIAIKATSKTLLEIIQVSDKTKSKAEIRRLVEQGGIRINNIKVTDVNYLIAGSTKPYEIKIGKRGYLKLIMHENI